MYGGTVSNVRELQAMGDEVRALQRRVSSLEDSELDVMERLEPVESTVGDLRARRSAAEDQAEGLRRALTVAEAEIDVEAERVAAERAEAVVGLPDSLVAEYDGLRHRLGGIGVARLVNGQCGGCHLRLSAVELDRVRRQSPDDMVHCEECGRLLVR